MGYNFIYSFNHLRNDYSAVVSCGTLDLKGSVQFSSVAQLCPIVCNPMNCSTSDLPVHHQLRSLLKLMSVESVMPSSHLILCCPLLLLPPVSPSIRVFSNESALHMRWPKYWSFSFSISHSSEHPGLISFRMDWLDLLAVQETLKSLLQHHSSKASILQCSAFFIVQLSHPYMTTVLWCCVHFCAVFCIVIQSCPTLCDSVDCSPPGFSVHGILQARILGWVAMPFSRRFSQPRDQTHVSHIAGRFFTTWATREAQVNFYCIAK